jgi:hypothetical protein
MYSMSGDVVELPVGGVIRKKNSAVTQQAEMQRLGQLADILGMSPLEVRAVQQDLAGQAFKQQVRLRFWVFGLFNPDSGRTGLQAAGEAEVLGIWAF